MQIPHIDPGLISGLDYLGMTYGPIQRPVPSETKQTLSQIWNTEHEMTHFHVLLVTTRSHKACEPCQYCFSINNTWYRESVLSS